MSNTTDIGRLFPAAYRATAALSEQAERAAAEAGLSPLLVELVKIRVSQLNGCAFCLRMHTRDALAAGETSDRLALVAAWWESQYFDATERSALALAERVTRVGEAHFSGGRGEEDATRQALDPKSVAAVTWLAVVMNTWNRVAICSGYTVAP